MIQEKRFLLVILISLILLFILRVVLHGENAIVVKLKDNSVVSSDYIYLKDISMIIGDNILKNVKIGKSPAAGQSIWLNKRYIFNMIISQINLKNKSIKIFGPENVKVTRNYFIYNEKIIKDLCLNFLKQHSTDIFKNKKWKIIQIISPPQIILPYKNVDVQISCNDRINSNRLSLNITFYEKGENKILKKANVIVFFEIYKKVIVAKENIPPRRMITLDLIEIKEVPIRNLNRDYIDDINKLKGKVTTRFIRRGQIISFNMLKTPPLVKRGELVKVIATDGKGIIITTIGKALENGFLNRSIRIMNISSGKVFIAKVKGINEVIVKF